MVLLASSAVKRCDAFASEPFCLQISGNGGKKLLTLLFLLHQALGDSTRRTIVLGQVGAFPLDSAQGWELAKSCASRHTCGVMLIQEPLGMLGLRHDGADGGLGALELQVLLLVEVGLSVSLLKGSLQERSSYESTS